MLFDLFSGGGFYQTLSPIIGADTAINIFSETREIAGEKRQTYYGTPGRKLFIAANGANGGNRGEYVLNGRKFVVIGAVLYEVNTGAWTKTALGAIPNDGFSVTFASNGTDSGGNQ